MELHRRRGKREERSIEGRESLKALKLKVLLNKVTQPSVKFLYRIYIKIRRILFATPLEKNELEKYHITSINCIMSETLADRL